MNESTSTPTNRVKANSIASVMRRAERPAKGAASTSPRPSAGSVPHSLRALPGRLRLILGGTRPQPP
jgi:hypothetical protein